jgi:hypothetical protein
MVVVREIVVRFISSTVARTAPTVVHTHDGGTVRVVTVGSAGEGGPVPSSGEQ